MVRTTNKSLLSNKSLSGARVMVRYKFFWQGCKDGNAGVGLL